MTNTLPYSIDVGPEGPAYLGLPKLGPLIIARRRLGERLNAASEGLLTVVESPSGAGKTLGVADWAARSLLASKVLWLNAGTYSEDVRLFWCGLRTGLLHLGAGPLPQVPPPHNVKARWTDWLTSFAGALSAGGGTWTVVLDDYPTGACRSLGRQIAVILAGSARAVRLVVICRSSPALDVHGLRLAGEYSHIGLDSLSMNEQEIGQMLTLAGVTPEPHTVSSVYGRTYGWARGVGIAAEALDTSSPPDVMDQVDLALDDVVEREVLTQFPAAGRELILRTSVAAEISAGVACAIMGADPRLSPGLLESRDGFVDIRPDGSFRCHPLLRRTALRRLEQDWPALAREARRAAAAWYVDSGDTAAGLQLAAEAGDWNWIATALVRSMAVPSIVLGAADGATARSVERSDAGTAEPLILAAAAVARGDVPAADVALARGRAGIARMGEPELAHRLSQAVIEMAISRQRCDHEAGLRAVAECRQKVAELGPREQRAAPELSALLNAYEGAFLLSAGHLDRAVAVLEPTAYVTVGTDAEHVAAAQCAGLLGLLEALRGDLAAAARHAAEVLVKRPADGVEVGVGYAQLAAAWIHLERGELEQAGQRLHHAIRLGEGVREPWLAAARRLAEARLATAVGEPEVALRVLAVTGGTTPVARPGWLADRISVAMAEAHLAAGDPQQVLATLTPEPRHTMVEGRVLAAAARRAIGDKRGARALLTSVEGKVAEAPLPTAVQAWILEAQLAGEAGDARRARALVDRALRAASREELRLTLFAVTPWVLAFVDQEPDLSRCHRSFIASLIIKTPRRRNFEPSPQPDTLLEPLTERELQVLERLAQLRTTEEIAIDLFVSANTVKTHIKSLFLKLAVNRRADAVRRGRGLALC
ncbi:MAG: hypothetical protein JWN06_1564 [Propionibacteriaceae bacterium]|jgi:LuxR family maltose regulon positive regulatory protein|nr:hypothetical protein [Propionibacteriaceae bacterium]